MQWREVGKQIIGAGLPLLGTALAGPAGGLIGAAVAGALGVGAEPESVAKAIQDPDAVVKLRELEVRETEALTRVAIRDAELEAERRTAQIREVNRTMRAEGKSEHWLQWSWRPLNGVLFGLTMFSVYFILPLVGRPIPAINEWVWLAWGSVLGVAAWHRGVKQRVEAGEALVGGLGRVVDAVRGAAQR